MFTQFIYPQTFTLFHNKITENILLQTNKVKTQEMETTDHKCDQKQNDYSDHSKSDPSDSFNLKKLRKSKQQKLNQIHQAKTDDGRGGNCVAANLSKTFTRIIESNLKFGPNDAKCHFRNQIKKYEIKSQKQNAFILVLILHTFVGQNLLTLDIYRHIVKAFLQSIRASSDNCVQKTIDEPKRKDFHLKNRKMYVKFGEIVREIFQKSTQNLTKGDVFQITDLQAIISDVYERKERETEKSIQKIISIILNHQQLRQLFNCHKIDIEECFIEAIDFGFRRNLPKKCKQIKQRVNQVFSKFRSSDVIQTDEDRYLMCYLALDLIEQKAKIIWDEFMLNISRKQEFNKTKDELREINSLLEQQIPQQVQRLKQMESLSSGERSITNNYMQQERIYEVKIQEGTDYKMRILQTYKQISKNFEF